MSLAVTCQIVSNVFGASLCVSMPSSCRLKHAQQNWQLQRMPPPPATTPKTARKIKTFLFSFFFKYSCTSKQNKRENEEEIPENDILRKRKSWSQFSNKSKATHRNMHGMVWFVCSAHIYGRIYCHQVVCDIPLFLWLLGGWLECWTAVEAKYIPKFRSNIARREDRGTAIDRQCVRERKRARAKYFCYSFGPTMYEIWKFIRKVFVVSRRRLLC